MQMPEEEEVEVKEHTEDDTLGDMND